MNLQPHSVNTCPPRSGALRRNVFMRLRLSFRICPASVFLLLLLAGCSNKILKPSAVLQEVNGENLLLGEVQYQDILAFFPRWQEADKQNEVDPLLAEQLEQIKEPLDILCYLGTWCGDSREGVPPVMKALDAAQNKHISIKLVGVDRRKLDPENSAVQYGINRVPTFILFRNGQEIGRMEEFPLKENFVEDLLDIVNSR